MFVDPLNGYMCVSGGLFDHSASGVNIGILNWELVDTMLVGDSLSTFI